VKLVVSRPALADIQRLHEFLASKDAAAAQTAVAVIDRAAQSLLDLPQRGRPSGISGIRELLVPFGRSAYLLRYGIAADRESIVILRVWHCREKRD